MDEIDLADERWSRAKRSCFWAFVCLASAFATAVLYLLLVLTMISSGSTSAADHTLWAMAILGSLVGGLLLLAANGFLIHACVMAVRGMRTKATAHLRPWPIVLIVCGITFCAELKVLSRFVW